MQEWFANKNVALVGNAMSLFDKTYGEEIDSHEIVVRLNKAAMLWTAFDNAVSHGTRTTHWMMYQAGEYRSRFEQIDPEVKKMHMSKFRQTAMHRRNCDFMMAIENHQELSDDLGHRNPTTGLMALYWLNHCQPRHVDVYGFDWKITPTFTDPDRAKDPTCDHNYPNERDYCFKKFFWEGSAFTWKD